MNILKRMTLPSLVASAVVVATAGLAQAAPIGTPAGDPVDNQAFVSYSVSAVPQAAVASDNDSNDTNGLNPTRFLVDRKLDMAVVEVGDAHTLVAPGQTDRALTFTITNEGNDTQDFLLTAANLVTGTLDPELPNTAMDSFDADFTGPNFGIYIDGDNDGEFTVGPDTLLPAGRVSNLASGDTVRVIVVTNIPAGVVDAEIAVLSLTAQVAVAGGGAAITADDSGSGDDPTLVQNVFADAAGTEATDVASDGKHSDRDTYEVQAAILDVEKRMSVICDPINDVTNQKAIPGALVRYTVTITNNGTAAATAVEMVDLVESELTFIDGTGAVGCATGTPQNIIVDSVAQSSAVDADDGEFDGGQVKGRHASLAPAASVVMTFDAVVN